MTFFSDRGIDLSQLTSHYRERVIRMRHRSFCYMGSKYDARDWDEIARFLAEYHRVFALTQRGHGESARPGVYSFEGVR